MVELPSDFGNIALRYDGAVRWLVDGYNVIRRSPELTSREGVSLEAGRQALCGLLTRAARVTGDHFTVVFDGAGGGSGGGGDVAVVFSSARESADRVLGRMARRGGAVVSNDREVRRAAARAGAIAVSTDDFLTRLEAMTQEPAQAASSISDPPADKDKEEEVPRGPRKGNPRKLGKKARARARVLGRLAPFKRPD